MRTSLPCQLFVIQNFTQTFGSFAPSWSITNEVFYYLFYGLLVAARHDGAGAPAMVGMAICVRGRRR